MFVGNYTNSADSKGRAMIPAKFRHGLGEKCMLVKGFDECLYLYTEEEYWKYAAAHIDIRPDEDEEARELKMFFYSNSRECELDGQGRILLPKEYLEYAGIIKEMVNIGFGNRIEIWSKSRFDQIMSSTVMNPKKLIANMKKYVDKS